MPPRSRVATYAVLIGVENYRDYDPSGRRDLRGVTQDVHAWWRLCREHLGIPGDQIRVLLRSAETGAGEPPSGSTDATRADIVHALTWLGEALATPDTGALLVYCGRGLGVRAAEGLGASVSLGLCPADLRPDLEAALTFAEIRDHLLARAPGTHLANLTTVVDACWSSEGHAHARGLDRIVVRGDAVPPHEICARLLLATAIGGQAQEVHIAGNWRGAFSFALQTLMSRWCAETDPAGGARYLNATYADLMARTAALVDVVGLAQVPRLLGSTPNLGLLPALRPGASILNAQTVDKPNQGETLKELTGNANGFTTYSFKVLVGGEWLPFGRVVAIGKLPPAGSGASWDYAAAFSQVGEYWSFDPTNTAHVLGGANPIAITLVASRTWDSIGPSVNVPSIDAALAMPQPLDPPARPLTASAWYTLPATQSVVAFEGTLTIAGVVQHLALGVAAFPRQVTNGPAQAVVGRVVWLARGVSAPTTTFFKDAPEGTTTSNLVSQTLSTPPAPESWFAWPPLPVAPS